jgi:cellulose synthase/poly-beta-1,6-N-acetylglucosamine synthase-like glycosyltransferase
VVGTSIDRLARLEYPPERLRIYVVDDASTDNTPDVLLERASGTPGAERSSGSPSCCCRSPWCCRRSG